jgi:hypothetical protein
MARSPTRQKSYFLKGMEGTSNSKVQVEMIVDSMIGHQGQGSWHGDSSKASRSPPLTSHLLVQPQCTHTHCSIANCEKR